MTTASFFFRALELKTRTVLPQHLRNPTKTKQLLIQDLIEDDDVQFLWSMLSIDITDQNDSLHLLSNIAELWITIRGFSMTGSWIDQYKKEAKKTVKRKKSLRKGLKSGQDSGPVKKDEDEEQEDQDQEDQDQEEEDEDPDRDEEDVDKQ